MYEYKIQDEKNKQIATGKDTDLIQCCRYDSSCLNQDPCPIHDIHPPRRRRPRAPQSEGESESEDPTILYRALRQDESPLTLGINPRADADPSISVRSHVTAGTRSKKKSRFISTTRSVKVAGSWAGNNGRVATFQVPPDVKTYDFTQQESPISLGDTALNAARASQEVVIDGRIPCENIRAVSNVHLVTYKVYQQCNVGDIYNNERIVRKYRTRRKTKEPVRSYIETVPL